MTVNELKRYLSILDGNLPVVVCDTRSGVYDLAHGAYWSVLEDLPGMEIGPVAGDIAVGEEMVVICVG